MKCSPEFRKRVAEQAELARRKAGRGYTGQLFFTYGEVKWILADLELLSSYQGTVDDPELAAALGKFIDDWDNRKITPVATPLTDLLEGKTTFYDLAKRSGAIP